MKLLKNYQVGIIGAGASGLLCALNAAKRGRRVAVLDHGPKAGRKIAVSGGGRCNFTHLEASSKNYLSENPKFCTSALARFTPQDVLRFFSEFQLQAEEKSPGQLFCRQGALAIVEVLERTCRTAGVDFFLNCRVTEVRKESHFELQTSSGRIQFEFLVVATGGLSWPQVGASGFGFDLAKQFGLGVISPRPGLVPLSFGQDWPFADLSGISLPVKVTIGKTGYTDDLLFTHRGLSGPVALQISNHWLPGQSINLDFLPGCSFVSELAAEPSGKKQVTTLLSRFFPTRLALMIAGPDLQNVPLAQLTRDQREALVRRIHGLTVTPKGTEGYAKAEVTVGGVDTRQLSSKTMEAKDVPGLYFIGEVVDVTGELGGYNLQWAWSSGVAAGNSV